MREYKKLQKLADKTLEQYNNAEFLEEMKSQIRQNIKQPQKAKVKKRSRLSFIACATAVSAVLIIVSVFIILPQKNIVINENPTVEEPVIEEKHYTTDNMETETVDLTVLNNGLTKIHLDNRVYKEIKKYYDKFYNDTLYYETELVVSEFENISLFIVPNVDYKYSFNYTFDKTYIIIEYELKFKEEYQNLGGLYECKVYGYMDTGAEKIYFTYNAYTMEQSSNFVNLVKELIKKK